MGKKYGSTGVAWYEHGVCMEAASTPTRWVATANPIFSPNGSNHKALQREGGNPARLWPRESQVERLNCAAPLAHVLLVSLPSKGARRMPYIIFPPLPHGDFYVLNTTF